MSFDAFQKFNEQNFFVHNDMEFSEQNSSMPMEQTEVLLCSPTTPQTAGGPCYTYDISRHVNNVEASLSEDDSYDAAIERMYNAAFEHATSNSQGVLLEAPSLTYKKYKHRYDSFMLATYINPANGQYFKKWISKDQSIACCTSRRCCWWMSLSYYLLCFIGMFAKRYDKLQRQFYLRQIMATMKRICCIGPTVTLLAETFLSIIQKLNNDVVNIVDYVKFVLKIPMMKDLLCIYSSYDDRYTCVSLLMSFSAFKHYVQENKLNYLTLGANSTIDCEEMGREEEETDVIKSPEEVEALDAWKAKFYELYHKKFSKMKNSTLIMTDKYNHIVHSLIELHRPHQKGPIKGPLPSDALKYDKVYELKSNIGKQCLYRKNLMVTTYKEVFDIMLNKHTSLGHARDIKKNKAKLDQEYYLIPESCVKLFLQICPYCFPARRKKQNNKVPLKMILTPRIGHRAQIDLIDMCALAISGECYTL